MANQVKPYRIERTSAQQHKPIPFGRQLQLSTGMRNESRTVMNQNGNTLHVHSKHYNPLIPFQWNARKPNHQPSQSLSTSLTPSSPVPSSQSQMTNDDYPLLDQQVFDRYLRSSPVTNPEHEPPPMNRPPKSNPLLRLPVNMLLHTIPPFAYRALERRFIYLVCQQPEALRCDLQAEKETLRYWFPDLVDRIENITFNSSPKVQHQGWYVPAQSGKPTIVYSGGNMESLLSIQRFLPLLDEEGYGFLNYEYPGYGSTPGKPSEKKLYRTIEAARNFLNEKKHVPDWMQIGYGTSLGGAVTVDSAAQRPFKALILESTLSSMPDVIRYQIGRTLPRCLANLPRHAPSQFNSLAKISRVESPLLIMHATEDELIPSQAARDLYQQAGTPASQKMLTLFPTNMHNLPGNITDTPIHLFLSQPFLAD